MKKLTRILGFIFGILIIVFIIAYSGLYENIHYLSHLSLAFVLISIPFFLLSFLMRALRWDILIENNEKSKTKAPKIRFNLLLMNLSILGTFMNIFLPLKLGDISKGIMLSKIEPEFTIEKSLASIIIERFFDLVSVCLYLIIPIFYFGSLFFQIPYLTISIIFVFSILVLIVILLYNRSYFLKIAKIILVKIPLINKKELIKLGIEHFFEESYAMLSSVIANRKKGARIIFLSLFIWFLEVISSYFIVLAFGIEILFLSILSAVIVANIIKSFPITPGGIGFYEFSFFIVLSTANIPQAGIISVLDHMIKILIILFLGGIMYFKYYKHLI